MKGDGMMTINYMIYIYAYDKINVTWFDSENSLMRIGACP